MVAKILNRRNQETKRRLRSAVRKLSESAVAATDAVVDSGATTSTSIIDTATTAASAVRSASATARKKVVDVSRTAVGGRRPAEEYVIVEELPDALKLGYVNTLVALTCFDDGQIDEREVCEIQVLMAQLRCSTEVRQAVRSGIDDPASLEAEAEIATILAQTPEGMKQALRCSLVKDAIRLDRAKSDEGSAREHSGIRRLAMTISPAVAETIVRTYDAIRTPRDGRNVGKSDIRAKLKLSTMLTLTHGLLASSNILRPRCTVGNPTALNVAQFAALAKQMLSLVKLSAERTTWFRINSPLDGETLLAEAAGDFHHTSSA